MRCAVLLTILCCLAGIVAAGCKSTVDGLESDIRTVLSRVEMDRLKDQETEKQVPDGIPVSTTISETTTPPPVETQPSAPPLAPPYDAKYALTVKPEPSDSNVSLVNFDGTYYPGIELTPGYYEVMVRRSGYEPFREWIKMENNKVLNVVLKRKIGAHAEKKPVLPKPGPEETSTGALPAQVETETEVFNHVLPDSLSGHQEPVSSLAFSPDGKLLASASYDNTVILWNMADGSPAKTLNHTDRLRAVAFSPDGKIVAAGGNSKNIHLWDVETGKPLDTFSGLSGRVNSIEFDPRGLFVAAGGMNEVMIWRINAGRTEAHMVGDDEFYPRLGSVNAVAFHPRGGDAEGFTLAFTCQSGIARYNAITKEIKIFADNTMPNSVTYSPDGRYMAWGARHMHGENLFFPRFVLTDTGKPDETISRSDPNAAADRVFFTAYTPGGNRLILLSYRQAVLYDLKTGSILKTFSGTSQTAVTDAALSPDGKILAAAAGNLIRLFVLD